MPGRQDYPTAVPFIPRSGGIAALAKAARGCHPSAVIRADDQDREAAYADFVNDLRVAAKVLK